MKAAVVEAFDRPPRYADFAEPAPKPGEITVTAHAAAISQLVRAIAAGRHYSGAKPPFVPGADGVGVRDDGARVYFAFPRPPVGAMAERVAVKPELTVELPPGLDDVTAAAIANPGMSSWAALVHRARLAPGETVLINGATGASGRLAIGIARHLGAGRVVATGRNPASADEIKALGADDFIATGIEPEALTERFRALCGEGVNVVLDYVWGPSAAAFLAAATGHGSDAAEPRIRFVNIGNLGGPSIPFPAAALRSSGLELMGSGLGSVAKTDLVAAIGQVFRAIPAAKLTIATETAPLAEVETAWARQTAKRLVLTF